MLLGKLQDILGKLKYISLNLALLREYLLGIREREYDRDNQVIIAGPKYT